MKEEGGDRGWVPVRPSFYYVNLVLKLMPPLYSHGLLARSLPSETSRLHQAAAFQRTSLPPQMMPANHRFHPCHPHSRLCNQDLDFLSLPTIHVFNTSISLISSNVCHYPSDSTLITLLQTFYLKFCFSHNHCGDFDNLDYLPFAHYISVRIA